MKKFSIVSPQQICKHLANNSKTKTSHGFPKSKRFQQPKIQCRQAYYSNSNSSSSLSKRHSGIGFGKRSDFTKTTIVSPASPTYKKKSCFEKLSRSHRFGQSRERSPNGSYINLKKMKNPGPGQYDNKVSALSTISYTNRPRTMNVVAKHLSFMEVPGPGTYDSVDLNPQGGRMILSNYRDSKFAKINPQTPKSPRFKDRKDSNPAPGLYSSIDDVNSRAKYILSKRRGAGSNVFEREKKFTHNYWKNDNKTPGPNKYDKPSDFGVYGDKEYYKNLRLMNSMNSIK